MCREGDHWDVTGGWIGLEAAGRFPAVHKRQRKVHENEVGADGDGSGHPALAIGDAYDSVPGFAENELGDGAIVLRIFDEQNVGHRTPRSERSKLARLHRRTTTNRSGAKADRLD